MNKRINNLALSLLIVVSCALLGSNEMMAQDNAVYRLYDSSTNTQQRNSSNNDVPDDLLHGKNPTIYIKNASVLNVTGEENPKVLKLLDISSSSQLQNENALYNDVEVITITLNRASDLNNRIDVNTLNGFNSLQYIYVKCLFECSEQQIRGFILNTDNITTIFYKVVNPS